MLSRVVLIVIAIVLIIETHWAFLPFAIGVSAIWIFISMTRTRSIRWKTRRPVSRQVHKKYIGSQSRYIPQDVRVAVAVRDGGKCVYCGEMGDMHYDHVVPWSKGGSNTADNIQLLCGTCNRRKSDR